MLLAAQRVRSSSGNDGINAFRYLHGAGAWPSNPLVLLDSDPGSLERQSIEIPPPGNLVRSYLDLVAPDLASEQRLRRILARLYLEFTPDSFPARFRSEDCAARFGVERGLAANWQAELYLLGERALALIGQSHHAPR
jgi:hypothetical protein